MKSNEYKLSEICHQICDGVHNTVIDTPTGDYYLLSAKNIKNSTVTISDDERKISAETYEKLHKRTRTAKGDILLTTVGASIGDTAIITDDNPNYEFQRSVGLFKPNLNFVIPEYLLYIFQSKSFQQYLYSNATGAAQPCLFLGLLKNIKISLPELKTQSKVVDIISSYDKLIYNNLKRIKVLEQMAENLYKEWFVRFRFPGHENAEFEKGIPNGWVRERISIYYNTTSGGTPSRSNMNYYESGVIPWIKTGEIKDSIILDTEEHISQEAINKSTAKLLPPQIVIMAMYGVNIGMLSYVDKSMSCNQACCAFIDKRIFSSRHYLFHYLKTIREYLLLIGFGAAQQNLSQDIIKNVRIVMPSDEIVKAFEEKEESYYQMIRELLLQNKNLIKQRDLLLPRLMSGKLEV